MPSKHGLFSLGRSELVSELVNSGTSWSNLSAQGERALIPKQSKRAETGTPVLVRQGKPLALDSGFPRTECSMLVKERFVSFLWNPLCVASKTMSGSCSCSCQSIKLPRRVPGALRKRSKAAPLRGVSLVCLCVCVGGTLRLGPPCPSSHLEALTASFRLEKLSSRRHSHAKEPHNCWQSLGARKPDWAERAFHYYNTMP